MKYIGLDAHSATCSMAVLGRQRLFLFNGICEHRMYLPLLIFEWQTGMLLGAPLRAEDVHPARRVIKRRGPRVQPVLRVWVHMVGGSHPGRCLSRYFGALES